MWCFIGIMIVGYCTYKLMKSASDADDKSEEMMNKKIHIRGEKNE